MAGAPLAAAPLAAALSRRQAVIPILRMADIPLLPRRLDIRNHFRPWRGSERRLKPRDGLDVDKLSLLQASAALLPTAQQGVAGPR